MEWRIGVRQLGLAAFSCVSLVPASAAAQTFTVPAGTTDTVPKTLSGTQTGTIEAGGTLSGTTAITWSVTGGNPSPFPGVTIDNSGAIIGSTRAIGSSGSGTPRNLTLWNREGGTITGVGNDAFQIGNDIGNGTINVYNYGTILSTGGQGLDFDDIDSTTGHVNITNFATGIIKSTANDAVRPGQGAMVTNYGLIFSEGAVGASNDGIDWQGHSGTVINKTGGTISGFRHGITTDVDVDVTNEAGATIIGRNGSGVGSDGAGTVLNYGRITGAADGSGTSDGDGVDVDNIATITNYGIIEGIGAAGFKDGLANASEGLSIGGGTILNYGTISGADTGIVVNNDGNLDRSGIAATDLTNHGMIVGQKGYAIRMENKLGTAADNDTIVNYGTIVGNGAIPDPSTPVYMQDGTTLDPANGTLNGVAYGPGSARFIRGDGSAIQMGEGSDILTNYGVITGNTGRALNLEGGTDALNVMTGSRITGLADGGDGSDTLNYNKIGLTEAKRAALQAGQTVNIGGTLYTSFEAVNGAAQSFSSFATTNGTRGVAAILDNGSTTIGATAGMVALMDSVAASSDVNAALSQLSPAALQGLSTFGIATAQQTISQIGQHQTDARLNGTSVDLGGAGAAMAMFNDGLFSKRGLAERPFSAVGPFDNTGPLDAMAYAATGHGGAKGPAVASDQGLFFNAGLSFARQGTRADAPATRATTASVVAGTDWQLSERLLAGVFGGFAHTGGDLDTAGSKTSIDTATAGVYGTYQAQNWFATGMALHGWSGYDNTRIAVGTANTSSFNGTHYAVRGTVGTDRRFGQWLVTPEIGLQYVRIMLPGFTETGPAALAVGKDNSDSLRSSVGARFAYDYKLSTGTITPEVRIAWQHEFSNGIRNLNASFVDAALPGTFITATGAPVRDLGVFGTGLSGRLGPLTTVSLNYDAIVGGEDTIAHQLTGRLKHRF